MGFFTKIHICIPKIRYLLSSNLKNAYQELNFFIFKYGASRKITAFYLPLVKRMILLSREIKNMN